jgi:antagonist of KipI
MSIEVIDGGLRTTVQDLGRPDTIHLGVPEGGAADPWSHAVANLLLGNAVDAATLEMTLVGPTLRFPSPVTVALAGADLGGRVRGGRRVRPGRSERLEAGDVLEFPGAMADSGHGRAAGARAYLALPGGVDVPLVLGSRSTCLAGGFGGFDGRSLTAADRVDAAAEPGRWTPSPRVWPTAQEETNAGPVTLRVLPFPDGGSGDLTRRPFDALVGAAWRVTQAADRTGVRLDPAMDATEAEASPDPRDAVTAVLVHAGGDITTQGVVWGAVQLPPDGHPILLGADHGTTGGYRIIAVVIAADRPILGQLRPGAPIRLTATDPSTALHAIRERSAALRRAAATLGESERWESLIDAAGA